VFADIPLLSERSDAIGVRAHFVTWQDLYGVLARGAPKSARSAHVNWLLREVLGYMESEGLKATEIKSRHIAALESIEEALAALEAVLDRASLTLSSARWKAASKAPKFKENYWQHEYRAVKAGEKTSRRTPARLAWGFADAELFAGIYFERNAGGEVRPRADDEWRAAIQANPSGVEAWEDDDSDRKLVWVGRTRSLKDLLRVKTVEAQGDQVASFVDDVFSAILAARRRETSPTS
jgi:hypothetical protein